MSRYLRDYTTGGTYFFTIVTADRRPLFSSPGNIRRFRDAYRSTNDLLPFHTLAGVILPDHLHCIWEMPGDCADYSRRWRRIKRLTTNRLKSAGIAGPYWQPRFWEHRIRDLQDLQAHMDYIHYNPVKHGLVEYASSWSASTIHHYIQAGLYSRDWGMTDGMAIPETHVGEP